MTITKSPRAKPSEPRTLRGQRTRERLLSAAEHIFGSVGYHAANITDITRQAKVSAGTFYTYFNSKEELFRELVVSVGREMRRTLTEASEPYADRLEQERAGFTAFFRLLQQHRYLYRILRQAEFVDEKLYREHFDRFAKGYIAGLNRAVAEGQIRALDTDVVAWCLMGIGEYLGLHWTLWGKDAVPSQVVDTVMELISDGLRIRRPAPEQESETGVGSDTDPK